MANGVKHLLEFGPYRVDPEHRLLLRGPDPIPLSPKAFDLLLVLVERSGEVVSKDDLMKLLWPDTFVEESNLGQHVFQLRKALGERPQSHTYIITVPGRGYRFAEGVKDVVAAPNEDSLVVRAQSIQRVAITAELQRRHWLRWLSGALLLLGSVGGYVIYRSGHGQAVAVRPAPRAVSARRSVAVLGFRDLSRRPEDAWISTAFAEMLSTELAAGEKLRLVAGEDVARAKQDLRLPDEESLSHDTLRRVYKNLNSDYVVLGSYSSLPGKSNANAHIRVDLRLQDAVAGETVAEVATVGTEDDLFQLASQAGAQLRQKLGVPTISLDEAVTVKASLPANPEAARLYAQGLERLRVFDTLAARDLLQRAVAADPKYPLAHAALSQAWSALAYDRKAKEEASRAYELSGSLSQEDRLLVEGEYRIANHESEKAIAIYRALFTLLPDNLDYGLRLAVAQRIGSQPNDALATVASLRRLPTPFSTDPRIDLEEGTDWIWASAYQRAQEPLKRALEESRSRGAHLMVARTLLQQCRDFHLLGQTRDAIAACREARDNYAAAGDRAGEASVLRFWADAIRRYEPLGPSRVRQFPPETGELYRQALTTFRSVGSAGGIAGTMNSLGMLYSQQGEAALGEKAHREALAIFLQLDNNAAAAVTTDNLADDRVLQGDLAGAMNFYEEGRALHRAAGDPMAFSDYSEANVHRLRGELSSAKLGFEQALQQLQKDGDPYDSGFASFDLGKVLLAEADFAGARKAFEQSLAYRQQGEDEILLAETKLELAKLSIEEGKAPADVEPLAREAVENFRKENALEDQDLAWALLARTLFAQRKFRQATQAVAQALSGKIGFENQMLNSILAARLQGLSEAANPGAKDRAAALTRLGDIAFDAHKRGFAGVELEARLAEVDIEMKSGMANAARHRAVIERDARAKGMILFAQKVSSASNQ
jgi:eukaryotic-like serine/threonine-protein kinase